jgi:SPP1 gp7 family putative phage head morphogenesis protein
MAAGKKVQAATQGRYKVLAPVHPNIGLELEYTRKLEALLDALHKSIMWWVVAGYKANTPSTVILAQDDSSSIKLDKIIKRLTRYWNKKFNEAAKDLAKYFATTSTKRAENSLEQILKASGFAIKFKVTVAANDVLQSTVKANVALITNMSQRHLKEIEGMVMRSVQTGRDIGTLATELEERYVMTKKRARLIARDQNNKATASIVRVRQQELGIKQAKWLHSHAGKKPRPTHVAMNGKLYDISKGMWDPAEDKFIYPGELINCRCVSRSIISELGREL